MGICSSSKKKPEEDLQMSIRSIMLIQGWYRRYKARLELRQRRAWEIYQAIEYKGEQTELKLADFFNNLIKCYPRLAEGSDDDRTQGILARMRIESDDLDAEDKEDLKLLEKVKVEASYKGPHLSAPLDLPSILKMMECFRGRRHLHKKYVIFILLEALRRLKALKNITAVDLSLSHHVTIVGDLHGSFDDLETIFKKNGPPTNENPYIFNGDFVDRQDMSVEVGCTILAYFILYPGAVFLNRGNHEDSIVNFRYGFTKEIILKYRSDANLITALFTECFCNLPLMTVVDQKVLVVHGGISSNTSMEALRKIKRNEYATVLKESEKPLDTAVEDLQQLSDILWSDPRNKLGCRANDHRGGGVYFGEDVTRGFLDENKLELIVRSHECKKDGFEWQHQNKVVTIFSVADYYGEGSNLGAYLVYTRGIGSKVFQFSRDYSRKRRSSLKDSVLKQESAAMKQLKEIVTEHKEELKKEFVKYDSENTGFIKINEWAEGMGNVLQLNLPWLSMRETFAVERTGGIDYVSSLNKFNVSLRAGAAGSSNASNEVQQALYQNRNILEGIFRLMDKDNSGYLSPAEFEEACITLNQASNQTMSKEEIHQLAESMDINKDGQISFNEFLECFRINVEDVSRQTSAKKKPEPEGEAQGESKAPETSSS
eukprot:Nk52_evm23s2622 gene=Nk52_evmTU23s2622